MENKGVKEVLKLVPSCTSLAVMLLFFAFDKSLNIKTITLWIVSVVLIVIDVIFFTLLKKKRFVNSKAHIGASIITLSTYLFLVLGFIVQIVGSLTNMGYDNGRLLKKGCGIVDIYGGMKINDEILKDGTVEVNILSIDDINYTMDLKITYTLIKSLDNNTRITYDDSFSTNSNTYIDKVYFDDVLVDKTSDNTYIYTGIDTSVNIKIEFLSNLKYAHYKDYKGFIIELPRKTGVKELEGYDCRRGYSNRNFISRYIISSDIPDKYLYSRNNSTLYNAGIIIFNMAYVLGIFAIIIKLGNYIVYKINDMKKETE